MTHTGALWNGQGLTPANRYTVAEVESIKQTYEARIQNLKTLLRKALVKDECVELADVPTVIPPEYMEIEWV